MALTLDQRIDAAHNNTIVTGKVTGALVKHAKWELRTEDRPAGEVTLARNVLNNPDGYVWRFSAALLTEPVFDALDDITALTDVAVSDAVAELFPLFAGE